MAKLRRTLAPTSRSSIAEKGTRKKIAAVKRQVARKENEETEKARTHRLLEVGAGRKVRRRNFKH